MDKRALTLSLVLVTTACAQGEEAPAIVPATDTNVDDTRIAPVDTAIDDTAGSDGVADTGLPDAADGTVADTRDAGDVGDASTDAGDAKDAGDSGDAGADAGDAKDAADVSVDAGPTGAIVLLGCNSGSLVQARYTASTGWSSLGSASGTCAGAPAAAALSDGAIAVARGTDNGIYTSRYGVTSWGAFTKIYSSASLDDTPLLSSAPFGAIVGVLDGTSFVHKTATYDGSIWETALETLPGGTVGAVGPLSMSIAALTSTQVGFYRGNDKFLYTAVRSGSTWGASTKLTVSTDNFTIHPLVVATGVTSPDVEAFYVGTDTKLYVMNRTSGTFGAATTVAPSGSDASTSKGFAVTKTSSGSIVVAFVGTDGKAYALVQSTAGGAFSAPVAVDASGDVTWVAVTPGLGSDLAMLVTGTTATGAVRWSRLTGTTWSSVLNVGGGSAEVFSLATTP